MVELPLSRYRFQFTAVGTVRLTAFAGSAWRGAFGTALKRTVCAMRLRDCEGCPLIGSCVFPYLFEGRRRPDATVLRSLSRVPVPFIFHPPTMPATAVEPGNPVTVDLGLVGNANDRLIYAVRALGDAGEHGIGPGRGRLALRSVDRLGGIDGPVAEKVFEDPEFRAPAPPRTPPCGLDSAKSVSIEFRTPLRLKVNGNRVTPENFHPAVVADAAVRRISALATFHAASPIEADFRELKRLACGLEMRESSLHWEDWARYSSRQAQKMSLGGIVGRCTVEVPEEAAPLLRWLDLAQWVGVGKGASMGLGQIRLIPADGGTR
jgi:hypothetical protein